MPHAEVSEQVGTGSCAGQACRQSLVRCELLRTSVRLPAPGRARLGLAAGVGSAAWPRGARVTVSGCCLESARAFCLLTSKLCKERDAP